LDIAEQTSDTRARDPHRRAALGDVVPRRPVVFPGAWPSRFPCGGPSLRL